MARLLALTECTASLRNHLLSSLRSQDEAVLLPQAERVAESGSYKNISFRLAGAEENVPVDIFSPSWFHGVSAVRIDSKYVDAILQNPQKRQAAMEKLKAAIPSETASSSVQVGPSLDCDADELDAGDWSCGFDGANCSVGIYVCEHSTAPILGRRGLDRVHANCYLVCKAGAGLAALQWHSRFITALQQGESLEQCLEKGAPGPQALRRLEKAGTRNRARILLEASKALNIPMLDSVPDQSSKGKYRLAVLHVDTHTNTIRKLENTSSNTVGSVYQYTTGLDGVLSSGLVSLSNVGDGAVLFLSANGETRVTLRNKGWDSLPFSSRRIISDTHLLKHVTSEHKDALTHNDHAHPDHDFICQRFCWLNREFSSSSEANVEIEPLCTWGTHDREEFTVLARELGVGACQIVRLRPALVLLAGMEAAKLRAALRNIKAV